VYETLVKPDNPILDYNTVFSGLREGDLDHVRTTLRDVQKRLLDLFNDRTIVIGHALRNDLKALKILHNRVIDTEEVFPHPKGLPFTRSLKRIVQETFNMNIQMYDHDSRQDAVACMNLMLRRVIHELKKYFTPEQKEESSPLVRRSAALPMGIEAGVVP
jgi:RNA exonuclease 1